MSTQALFTLREIAEQLSIPYEVVRDNVYAGRWPHSKFSERTRRMSAEDVERVRAMTHHEPSDPTRSEAHQRTKRMRELLRAV
ncbi:hypothetical protein RR49_01200 [Microbacterium ginsengisoli]|uniref:DNA-binding protein n=1 Tax=Microbacterium ginsengisoli TaxID=400772 RepID=A0A0F0LVD2_9MICO|nr:hypothetical protein [Microbacterium ginsengisoli]KJL37088.1 hypothetical protein RR49_01200 [Microbacterium ginsengisoli]